MHWIIKDFGKSKMVLPSVFDSKSEAVDVNDKVTIIIDCDNAN